MQVAQSALRPASLLWQQQVLGLVDLGRDEGGTALVRVVQQHHLYVDVETS